MRDELKEEWEYEYPRELHDRFARVYCEDKFSNTEVDINLMHRFLEVAHEYYNSNLEIDKEAVGEKLKELHIRSDIHWMDFEGMAEVISQCPLKLKTSTST